MITNHFKTPQDIIQDYYRQKHLESVAPQSTKFFILARANRKRLLRQLYLKKYFLEPYFAELARKNYRASNEE